MSDDYLATLRRRGVSYVLAGQDDVGLPLALERIGARFGVRTLMLDCGGGINGSFLAGLIVAQRAGEHIDVRLCCSPLPYVALRH